MRNFKFFHHPKFSKKILGGKIFNPRTRGPRACPWVNGGPRCGISLPGQARRIDREVEDTTGLPVELHFQIRKNQRGYAALTTTVLALIISLTIIGGFTFFAFQEMHANRNFIGSVTARSAADGGIEDLAYRIVSGKQFVSPENLAVGSSTVTLSLTTSGNHKYLLSEGLNQDFQQNMQMRIDISSAAANFVYGVQVGDGGLEMQNSASVAGSVYVNGNIVGHNSPTISGDAFAAGTSQISAVTINGSAQAHQISNSLIGGSASSTALLNTVTTGKDAHAYQISGSNIGRDAYYQIIDQSTTVNGTKYPGSAAPSDLQKLSMPISDTQLDQFEQEAAAGGTISSPCPYTPPNNAKLGPVKINCDVNIGDSLNITITGPVWIAGNLNLSNTAVVQLASSFGSNSSEIVVDNPSDRLNGGTVSVANSVQILGSGTAGSYLMIVSRNNSEENGGNVNAIDVNNSSTATIYYAPHGKIDVSNNSTLKEATAYGIEMENSAKLIYESGLQNVNFTVGPTAGYDAIYWKQVE